MMQLKEDEYLKITVNRQEFLSLAKAADSIAPSNTSLDALKCTMLDATEDNRLCVAATNLEVALEQTIKADVYEPGTLIINAGFLANMLERLAGESVTLSGEDSRQVSITSGTAHYQIPVLSAKDYPRMEIPFPEDTVAVTGIPAMARRTVFAASDDENKPLMRCVNLVFTSEGLKAVGCDGSRLAAARGDSKSAASASMLVPASSLTKLARLISNKDELYVGTTGKSVVFTKENFAFSSRLMEGNYINADMMLNNVSANFTVLTDTALLLETVSAVTAVAGQYTALSLKFEDAVLHIRCESELGTSERVLDTVPLSGTPCGEYWYSHHDLMGCLKALGGTLVLEIGQNGVLLLRTDELICLQMARRKPVSMPKTEMKPEKKQRAVKKAA